MCDTDVKMDGKVVIVTGGSSGIGFETAKSLAKRGARVIIASRNETKLQEAKNQIVDETGNLNVSYKTVDFASLKSVRNFANEIKTEDKVNVLVNNVGAVALSDVLTADDLNLTMQVNFFGAFLLTYLLLPKLKMSAPSRIVNGVASSMYFGDIDFEHWNDVGRYNFISSLSNSKLAMALFNAELVERLNDSGVTANTFDPFVAKDTSILDNFPGVIQKVSKFFINLIGQEKEVVGNQIAYLASAPELESVSGKNYKFCHEFFQDWRVSDRELTKKLWEEAKKLVQIGPDEDWENDEP